VFRPVVVVRFLINGSWWLEMHQIDSPPKRLCTTLDQELVLRGKFWKL